MFSTHSGNGHPLWLKTHPPAPRTATAVDRLLAAGAHMVGKTHSDEMAYSLDGENVHLWDINPKALDRIPGGSSSGLGSGRSRRVGRLRSRH
jgi:amidase